MAKMRPLTPEDWEQVFAALDFGASTETPKQEKPLGSVARRNREVDRRKGERAKPWQKVERGGAVCYFIGADDGPVKIGQTRDLEGRLRTLQLGSPVQIRLLAVAEGGEAAEAEYHERFASARTHREWFDRTPEITAEIARLNRQADGIGS